MSNRKYSPEVMAAAVEASRGRDKQIVVAMTFGMPEGSLRYWRKKAGLIKPLGRPPKTHVTPSTLYPQQEIGRVS